MTREEASKTLTQYIDYDAETPDYYKMEEACKVAIKALSAEPCDCISRQAVLKIIDGWYEQNRDTENIEDLIVLITYMDSVNPQEPKVGHWLKENPFLLAECSECGNKAFGNHGFDEVLTDYCPNCGARMVEPQESEDKE